MLTYDFSPFPILETERLRLRRLRDSDVQQVFEMRSDEQNMKYIPRPRCQNLDEAYAHIGKINEQIDANAGINWAVTLKSEDKVIGIMGFYRTQFEDFRSEIGYMLHPDYHGRGIVTEAVKKLVSYGFSEMKLHSIEAVIDPENIASEKVLVKCGFVKEAHFRENAFYEGKFIDSVHYSIVDRIARKPKTS